METTLYMLLFHYFLSSLMEKELGWEMFGAWSNPIFHLVVQGLGDEGC